MKTWKLVSGILSIVLFVVVSFQSCAAGLGNALSENGESSGSGGILVAILMLSGGIVSIATKKSKGKGGNIALIVLFGLAALIGFGFAGSFADHGSKNAIICLEIIKWDAAKRCAGISRTFVCKNYYECLCTRYKGD